MKHDKRVDDVWIIPIENFEGTHIASQVMAVPKPDRPFFREAAESSLFSMTSP